jgi:hypothetical protein
VFFFSAAQAQITDSLGCQYELPTAELSKILAGKNIYQSFRISSDGRNQVQEFNLVMRQGQTYHFSLRMGTGMPEKVGMRIYSRKTKSRVFDSAGGGTTPKADSSYTCTETGVYDVKFFLKDEGEYCGVCICSFTK